MANIELVDQIDVRNTLGECVLWDERKQQVWWTDIHECRLYSYDLTRGKLHTRELPERLASFGFTNDDNRLICAFASGIALYEPDTGTLEWIARPEAQVAGTRFNDGRVDRQGRFWCGSMVEVPDATASGTLYCLSGRNLKTVLGGIKISNSICWSPDGSTFYFADSPSHTIRAYNFDASSGQIREPRLFAEIPPPFEPDGSAIDAEGHLWNAQWGGGKVVQYDSKGKILGEISLPVSQPTCVAFGGRDLNLLFVSSAKIGLTQEQLLQQPLAGNLLIYRTHQKGLAECRFTLT